MENYDYLDVKGRIFDIQRYSIHDGIGIRTIVFLKGCALRCRWCCNPESQSGEIETMLVNGRPKTYGQDVTVREVMQTVRRDMPYYSRSDGGMTLSGGESLLQPEFARALLQGAKALGVNTALESMGFARYETIEKILPYLDTYLMDIKHMDPKKHEAWCGKENTLMVENARRIAESGKTKLIIRVPVVPGFNDTAEELLAIAKYADSLPGVEEIDLLPYHNFGEGKYTGLGRDYPMGKAKRPSIEQMEEFQNRIRANTDLFCQIGG
ncbi:MAG: glycyl-radical enzyme activating protein [Lachnospiraceae bacterium]|nr:glycyl-radical enzyme activating protein [Lachnospiraceae bacterium]MBQ7505811.1 glycyl-radical enzyme activating protein [Lachnospiraceae bacterium]